MTDSVVIILSCGTDSLNRATRAIHLITVVEQGRK